MLSKNLKQKVSFIGNRKPPLAPLHGVDFSGASENKGRNNKIWIASWYPGEKFVSFKCGGDAQGFGRRDLADFILCWGGLWVIDFTFGPPEKVAEAAGWRSWQDYLAWCGSDFDSTRQKYYMVPILPTVISPNHHRWSRCFVAIECCRSGTCVGISVS